MSQSKHNFEATASRSHVMKWSIAGLLLLCALLIMMNLPRGFSDDLSRLGKGQAAIVLIRDKNSVRSFDMEQVMGSIRNKYTGRVEFLLIDADSQEGREFITSNNAAPISFALFNANGNLIKVLPPPQTAESMQQRIADTLGITP